MSDNFKWRRCEHGRTVMAGCAECDAAEIERLNTRLERVDECFSCPDAVDSLHHHVGDSAFCCVCGENVIALIARAMTSPDQEKGRE